MAIGVWNVKINFTIDSVIPTCLGKENSRAKQQGILYAWKSSVSVLQNKYTFLGNLNIEEKLNI